MYRTIAAISAALVAGAVYAQTTVTPDNRSALRTEIKQRCQQQMGQYGPDMVLACMEQDWHGAQRVMSYRQSHPQITRRCLSQMRRHGFDMVAACIEQDVDAAAKIENW